MKKRMDTTRHAGRLFKFFQEEDLMDMIQTVMNDTAAGNM